MPTRSDDNWGLSAITLDNSRFKVVPPIGRALLSEEIVPLVTQILPRLLFFLDTKLRIGVTGFCSLPPDFKEKAVTAYMAWELLMMLVDQNTVPRPHKSFKAEPWYAEKALSMIRAGRTAGEIAKAVGKERTTIRHFAKQRGLDLAHGRRGRQKRGSAAAERREHMSTPIGRRDRLEAVRSLHRDAVARLHVCMEPGEQS